VAELPTAEATPRAERPDCTLTTLWAPTSALFTWPLFTSIRPWQSAQA
jgi:hypothetical protein